MGGESPLYHRTPWPRTRDALTMTLLQTNLEVEHSNFPPMPIVTVKSKYQVVIPRSLRRQVRINVGDLLEASVQKGRITLIPKSLVDREIAEGLDDLKKGRTYGPYSSAAEMITSLHRMTRKSTRRKAT